MFITVQNINTNSIDFDSLVGKYICFRSSRPETLKSVTGTYVTNCNSIYLVKKLTSQFMIVEEDFHGMIRDTKFRKDTFERDFFDGHYVICDSRPNWDIEVGTYTIPVPDYKFTSNPDLSKSFTPEEINELLINEFLGQNKTYQEVLDCMKTLGNLIMKRHFNYVQIGRGYFQETNCVHVGLNIKEGNKYLGSFGSIYLKSYRNKIISVEFVVHDWINRYTGFEGFKFTTLEDLIVKYLSDNEDYIKTL